MSQFTCKIIPFNAAKPEYTYRFEAIDIDEAWTIIKKYCKEKDAYFEGLKREYLINPVIPSNEASMQ